MVTAAQTGLLQKGSQNWQTGIIFPGGTTEADRQAGP
jgi:hypothetical protein